MENHKLLQWVRRVCLNLDRGRCVKITLKHVGSRGGEVESFKVPVVQPNEFDGIMDSLANKIEMVAFDDAEGLSQGLQRYVCTPYFDKEGVEITVGRFTFAVAPSNEDEGDIVGMSEPANKDGLIAQQMRHTEAIMRVSVMSTSNTIAMLQRTINSQAEQITAMSRVNLELIQAREDLLTQKHERELMSRREEFKIKELSGLADKGKMLIPIIANSIMKKNLFPVKETAGDMFLKSFMESITSEQLMGLQSILTTEQLTGVITMIDAFKKAEEAKQSVEEEKERKRKENGQS